MSELPNAPSNIDLQPDERRYKKFPDQAYVSTDGTVDFRPARDEEYMLGNPNFPIAAYRELILDTVRSNLITIITAETGAGKSTNIPQYLFEGGFDRVIVTQPRILAARELKMHVADDIAQSLGDRDHELVGYQTAMEGDASEENGIVFETDGLRLMREINGQGIGENEVLVLDEFHERKSNMDALLALAVERSLRVVIASATLDADSISRHYEGVTQRPIPIIKVPGRTHEVTVSYARDLDDAVVSQAKQGKNIQVFLPGRKEINNVMSRMKRRVASSYTLLALHGDQSSSEQGRVMRSYEGGKIIFSTSVGQTSITISDIDVVIDSGFERSMTLDEYYKDVLATQPTSNASSDQRRGRVGRTKPGEYILAQPRYYPELPPAESRPAYDTPEIQQTQSAELQLKLATFGHSILSLPFYEKPSDEEIARSAEVLERLQFFRRSVGSAALNGYELTEMGKRAARLPLDPHAARMVIESRKYGPKVELQMMAAVAVAQRRGITHTARGMENWRKLTREEGSDIIAGIDFMMSALQRTEQEQEGAHIVTTRYDKALTTLEQLASRRNLNMHDLTAPDDIERELLLRSIAAGTDELYVLRGKSYIDQNGVRRRLVNSSVIAPGSRLLIGKSLDLQQVRGKTIKSNPLITDASSIDIATLRAVAPERVSTEIKRLFVDDEGMPRTIETVYFDGRPTHCEIEGEAVAGSELQRFIIERIFSEKSLAGIKGERIKEARRILAGFRRLQHKTTEDLGIEYSLQTSIIERLLRESNFQSVTFDDMDPFIDIDAINDIVPVEIRDEVNGQAPDTLTITVDRREITLKVTYHDSAAYITAQPAYYEAIPFTIGNNHKVYVKPTDRHAEYVSLGKARAAFDEERAQPTRQTRRGRGSENTERTTPNPKKNIPVPQVRSSVAQRPSTTRRGR